MPSLALLMLAALLLVALMAVIMVGLWALIRFIGHGEVPPLQDQPIKMFIAAGCAVVYTLCAGVIHRRLTRAEIRGRFVLFSKTFKLKNTEAFSFSLVDKRQTQLIGTKLVLEVVSLTGVNIHTRRVQLGSPGILAIPAEITIPIGKIFPSLSSVVCCDECGKSGFSAFKAYAAHMSHYHGVTKIESRAELEAGLLRELDNLQLLRVVLTGVDEVSGKGGIAVKEFLPEAVILTPFGGSVGQETFSVVSRYEDIGTDGEGDSSDSEESHQGSNKGTSFFGGSRKGSVSSYVHVDFKYN